jgi:outer membrane lipoprotein-sorting protein
MTLNGHETGRIRIAMRPIPILPTLILGLCLWCIGPAGGAESIDAARIVEKADHIRFPDQGFQVDARVISITDGVRSVSQFRILSQNQDNTIVMTTAPASERGQTMLVKGQDLWVFMPNISQAVRLPLSQRLTGQVANGDLARANFSGDYDPVLLRTETIDGKEYHVLELTAVNRRVTYHRVLYWVEKDRYRPFKAEFYALSGNLLKTAHYRDYVDMAGVERPSKLYMQDPLKSGSHSLMEYSNMRLRELPDRFFTHNYLRRLQ